MYKQDNVTVCDQTKLLVKVIRSEIEGEKEVHVTIPKDPSSLFESRHQQIMVTTILVWQCQYTST